MTASSAGVRAVIGNPIHPTAKLVLEGLGGDASHFSARQLTPQIAAAADLIITMTTAHRDAVLERAPTCLPRTFTMSEAAWLATSGGAATAQDLRELRAHAPQRSLIDIADPMGAETEVFQAVGSQIAELVMPIVELFRNASTV